MSAALVAAAGYLPLALTGADYLELLPVAWRRIIDTGIQLDVLTYDTAVPLCAWEIMAADPISCRAVNKLV